MLESCPEAVVMLQQLTRAATSERLSQNEFARMEVEAQWELHHGVMLCQKHNNTKVEVATRMEIYSLHV